MTTKLDFKGETAETEHDQAVFTAQTERRTTLSRIERVVDIHIPTTETKLRRGRPVAAVLEPGGLWGWPLTVIVIAVVVAVWAVVWWLR